MECSSLWTIWCAICICNFRVWTIRCFCRCLSQFNTIFFFGCRKSRKIAPPYRVMLHNDNFNKREYVVQVLMKVIPGMTVDNAVNIMQEAHHNGLSVVIICAQADAEEHCMQLRSNGLLSSIEPASGGCWEWEEMPYGYGKPNVFVDVSYKIYLHLYIFVPVTNTPVNHGSVINYMEFAIANNAITTWTSWI